MEIRTLVEQYTAVVYGDEGDESWLAEAFGAARSYLERFGVGPVGPPFVRVIDGEAIAGYVATTPVGGQGDVEPSELPGGTVAVGDDEAAVRSWVETQGGTPAGEPWTVFVDGAVDGRREVVLPYTT